MEFEINHRGTASKPISFSGEFTDGARVALIGASGAGKSTLLHYLAGLNTQGRCSVLFPSKSLVNPKPWLSPAVLLHQHAVMFAHQTVEETLNFAGELFSQNPSQKTIQLPLTRWMQQLDIEELAKQRCNKLSGGQAQRVALLRAIASKPSWLLLDESFSALDTKSMVAACDVVSEFCDLTGAGLVLASHHDFPQRFLCDQAYIVENLSGRLEPDLFSALDQEQSHELNQARVTTVSVQAQAENHGFLETKIGQQSIFVTCPKRWNPGHARVSIPANEVSIAIGDDHQTSMVNRLKGLIRSITLKDNESVWVELEIEQQCVRVSISNWSHERLELKVDQTVFAEFKVGAVQWHGQSHPSK